MRTAELLVRCLENEGVDYIFGVPGEEVLSLLDALLDTDRIKFISTRHEQGAALMADVYGRLTGRPGVCLSTLGPGATNLMTGVADAYLDHAPLVAITGQVPFERIHKESHQYVDTIDLFHAITKWQARVAYPEVVPEVVRKAFKVASAEKPGPTHIEVSEEVASEPAPMAQPLPPSSVAYPDPSPGAIKAAGDLISAAKRPMILAGNGVIRRRATQELRDFAASVGVPAVNTFMSKGVMGYKNPLAQLTVGLQNRDYELSGIAEADVVIAVGYDLVEFAPRFWNPYREKTIIHIDTLPAEVDENYLPSVEIVSEIGSALRALTEVCEPRPAPEGAGSLKSLVLTELQAHEHDNAFPMKPQRILADLRRVMADDDLLICDVGAHKLWVSRLFPAQTPNSVIVSNGFATMGIALPGAIAAKLAEPQRRVVALTGDGGLLMNIQELETARRLGTAFVIVLWVDDGYGVIRWKQETRFGRSSGVDFGNPDFKALASSFGVPGFAIERAEDFAPTLERALGMDVPSLIAVPVDYRENHRLTAALGDVQVTI